MKERYLFNWTVNKAWNHAPHQTVTPFQTIVLIDYSLTGISRYKYKIAVSETVTKFMFKLKILTYLRKHWPSFLRSFSQSLNAGRNSSPWKRHIRSILANMSGFMPLSVGGMSSLITSGM